jgi:Leucine-rich repeat (LRR) protein
VRVLHLSWNRIGLDGAKALAAALDSKALKLRELNLQNNRAIDNDGAMAFMRAIEHNQHLTKLWLSGTQVTLRGIFLLAFLPSLSLAFFLPFWTLSLTFFFVFFCAHFDTSRVHLNLFNAIFLKFN